jgi:hypothetical protein
MIAANSRGAGKYLSFISDFAWNGKEDWKPS